MIKPGNEYGAICSALESTLNRVEEMLGVRFLSDVEINCTDSNEFWAEVRPSERTAGSFVVEIDSAVPRQLQELWQIAWPDSILQNRQGERLAIVDEDDPIGGLVELSLSWLVLHELMHIQLRHFDLIDKAAIASRRSERNKAVTRPIVPMELFSSSEQRLVRQCLEMQADSEATDIHLGLLNHYRLAPVGLSEWFSMY